MKEVVRKAVAEARGNLIDRVVSYFDPSRGRARLRDRTMLALAGGYEGARRDKRSMKEWKVTGNSPDGDILSDLPLLRERSRDLVRNAPIAAGAVNTIVENVVATGLSLQSKPDAATLGMTDDQALELADGVERNFRIWAESTDCDITRTQNFYGLQDLAFRSSLESGDSFGLLPVERVAGNPFELRIQIIESDRVETPQGKRDDERTLSGGVEKDFFGAPVAYHFRRRHPGEIGGGVAEYDRIEAFGRNTGLRNVLHLFHRTRPGQTRGVPMLAPVIETLKQLDRYAEAEIMGAVLNAYFAAFVETEDGNGFAPPESDGSAGSQQGQIKIDGPGQIVDLMPGQTVKFADTKRPNTAFEAFTLAVCRNVGAALGLPFEILVKHFTASYSASRAAMLEAWRFFRGRRAFLALNFCDPVFAAWMYEAVAKEIVNAPGFFTDPLLRRAYLQCEWIGDSPGHVDPVKEVEAAIRRVDATMSTKADETQWLTGRDWRDVQRQRAREIAIERKAGTLPVVAAPAADPNAPANDQQDALREFEDATT